MSTAIYDLGGNTATLQTEIQSRIGATTNPAAGTVNAQLKDIEQNTQDSAGLLLDISNKILNLSSAFTSSTVSVGATSTSIVSAGAVPLQELWLYNSGSVTALLKFGAAATLSDYNFPLPGGMMVILKNIAATVTVAGITASGTASIVATRVTE